MRRLRYALLWCIDALTARPRLVVFAAMLLAAASTIYAIATLRLDTNTTDMIAAEVPFRQHSDSNGVDMSCRSCLNSGVVVCCLPATLVSSGIRHRDHV